MLSLSKCSEKIVFPKKLNWNIIFLVLSGKTVFFRESTILLFRRKMKDDLSQKKHGNMIFSVYSVKMVFLFPTKMISAFCQKSKDGLLPKKYT